MTIPSMLRLSLFLPLAGILSARELNKDGVHLFMLSGQSNMREPLPESFTAAVQQVFGKDKVLVVTSARPSQPIRKWYKKWAPPAGVEAKEDSDQGELYESLVKAVKRKIEGRKLASVTYIWMQGEADASAGWGAVYEESFYGVLEQFKEDLEITKINFVVGRINDFWLPELGVVDGAIVRQLQQKMGEGGPHGAWVDTDDLNTGLNPWGIYELQGGHFPPMGYVVMGRRFARKACQLIAPELKVDEKIFKEEFFDQAATIKSHTAVAGKITGTTPDSTMNEGGIASLLDGKYGEPDKGSHGWLGFSPNEKVVEFVVDLGKEQLINGLGVNLLIAQELKTELPDKITLATSVDGKTFQSAHRKGITFAYKKQQRTEWLNKAGTRPLLVLLTPSRVSGRYVQVRIEKENSWLLLDEIFVNPSGK